MKIVAFPPFQKNLFKECRLLFIRAPGESVIQAGSDAELPSLSEDSEDIDELSVRLTEVALNQYLIKHPEVAEKFDGYAPEFFRERALKSLKEGISEYIASKKATGAKLNPEWIKDMVAQMAETVCRVLMLESENSELEFQAKTDSLTGLPNRRAFFEHLGENIEKGEPLHFMIIDLDQFKKVNDAEGHQTGDEILKQVAYCIEEVVRQEDRVFVGRYGSGDEFVILANVTEGEACKIAGRVSEVIRETSFIVGSNGSSRTIHLTASIGISAYEGREKDPDGKKMINGADDCLYILKGERPDEDEVFQKRRGQIACNGKVIDEKPTPVINTSLLHVRRGNIAEVVNAA